MPASVHAAAGRRFDLVLPFGCEAPGALGSSGTMRWSFDPKGKRLRITVDPVVWQADRWTGAVDAGSEALLRGFWIARPWSSAGSCAAVRRVNGDAGGATLMPPAPSVAIARVIGADESGKVRPYEVVQRATAADFDPVQGFRLRITGRVRSPSEGGPVTCIQPGGGEQRPLCVITATFSEVRIENAKNGDVLANWSVEDDVRGGHDNMTLSPEAERR